MATKKIKINFKMPIPTAAERLHAQQQKNRKAAGLPDPSEYKKKLDTMKSEEVEQLDEVNKHSFIGKIQRGEKLYSKVKSSFKDIGDAQKAGDSKGASKAFKKHVRYANLRAPGTWKDVKEEVEPLDEISPQLKASYVAGAKKQIKQSEPYTKKGEEYRDIAKNFIAKRQKGIARANEEVEQLDEIGDTSAGRKALGNYINRSHESGDAARIQATYDKDNFAKHTKTAAKRSSGIAKAVTRLTKEQLEKKGRFVSGPVKQPFKSNTVVSAVKEGFRIGGMSSGSRGNVHEYDRNPPAKDGNELENVPFHAKTEKQKKIQNALNDLGKKMKETHPKLKEDFGDKIKIRKKGTNITKEISSTAYSVFKHHGFRKEEAEEPSMAARTLSRKAQIVKAAAKSKKAAKEEASDKFQKDPELSSDIHKT